LSRGSPWEAEVLGIWLNAAARQADKLIAGRSIARVQGCVERVLDATSRPTRTGRRSMSEEGGPVTGTKDKDYNIIWFTEQCLSNALRLETYAQDAERDGDQELAEFFRRAQGESRKGAEQGKALLKARLAG
jgi:hypothetical protein